MWRFIEKFMVRVAVVGIGFMGKTHLGIYSQLEGAKIAAMCDVRPEALNITSLDAGGNIKSTTGQIDFNAIRKFTEYDAMLNAGGFDVVDICLPTYLHVEFAVKALNAGYHVFCEKPLALDVNGTETVLKKVRETGKLFTVGQCLRFWPAYAEIKKLIDSGQYGSIKYAEFARFSVTPTWCWNRWLLDGRLSGNAALDLHVHDVDTLLHFFGKPRSLRSVGVFDKDGAIPHIATVYQYENFAVSSTGGWLCSDSFGFNMRAFFVLEQATIEMDFSKQPVVVVYPQGGEKFAPTLAERDGYYYELQDFIDGIERGQLSGIVTPESAAESVNICREEIRSVTENREITL